MRKNFCISSKNQRNIPQMYIAYLRNILMYVLWTSYIHTCGNYFTYIGYAFYILFIFYVYTQNMQYVCTYHGYTLHIFGIYLCMYYEHPMYVHVVIISHTQDMNFIYFSQSMYVYTQDMQYPYMYIHKIYMECPNVYWVNLPRPLYIYIIQLRQQKRNC